MDRVKTFIQGFDDVIGGGVPKGHVVLVCGSPGTMKTSVAFSILYNNVKAGSKGLYISLEESDEDLKGSMEDLGMTGIDNMELYILDVSKIRLEHKEEELNKNWIDIVMKYIEQRVKVNKFDLVAIDSLAGLYSLNKLENPRRELFHFFGFLRSLDATTFLVSEIPSGNGTRHSMYDEDFLSDGVLLLQMFDKGETDVQLRLRCVKMRRTKHDQGYYPLVRNNGQFQITRAVSG